MRWDAFLGFGSLVAAFCLIRLPGWYKLEALPWLIATMVFLDSYVRKDRERQRQRRREAFKELVRQQGNELAGPDGEEQRKEAHHAGIHA